jgi:hypothetical protein
MKPYADTDFLTRFYLELSEHQTAVLHRNGRISE